MKFYWLVRDLFLEQEGLQDCMETFDAENPDLSHPYPLCALAAMLVLAQGELRVDRWFWFVPSDMLSGYKLLQGQGRVRSFVITFPY